MRGKKHKYSNQLAAMNARVKELGMARADIAEAMHLSSPMISNYLNGVCYREDRIKTLARIIGFKLKEPELCHMCNGTGLKGN